MERLPRLTRSQLIERLREHAARHGHVSIVSLHAHDRVALRSIPLHFVGLDAARHAAGVSGPPFHLTGAKRGPTPGGKPPPPNVRVWTRRRVLAELRRLDRAGVSTRWDDLIDAGHLTLVQAATEYADGLAQARAAAGIAKPPPRWSKRDTWTPAKVLAAIRARRRQKASLAGSHVPQALYRAARWHFGSWPEALAALGIDARAVRATKRTYTKDEIIRRLQRAARDGSDLRYEHVKRLVDMKAVHREFGTLPAAICAAGLDKHLMRRAHGRQKWTREIVIETLRERAKRGEHRLTSGLNRVVQLYFGGVEAARVAAGVPSPVDLRRAARQQRRPRRPPKGNKIAPRRTRTANA
jgi:hypothetical protein